ncbi:hypothetical protein FEM48_Zijuj06G0015700 [Ziziphus jujuba var. spinosa]|uniref:HTH La-type RNA-binding domain-containing protein n=1 Tax=Ziziphus jujuba var. spinosa TaxID=714518 RepID=A0A978V6E5_ZIZJJ|nr:hypothetical protein FEM48_Zijuj06G0015700 [Ziziphus jujuba var. spinosa]
MAMAADSSSNHHSSSGQVFSGGDGDGADSPQLRRSNLPSAWAQVVRGEAEAIPGVNQSPPSSSSSLSSLATSVPEQLPFSDCSPSKAAPSSSSSSPPPSNSAAADNSNGNNGNATRPKKPAWNKPSNGLVEVPTAIDADSWPALSESTRASPKPSADPSSKPPMDGSVSNAQGPITTHSPKKQASTHANPHTTPNHALPTRQRPMKRGGGNNVGGPVHSSFTHPPPPPPPPPPFPVFPMPPNAYHNLIPAMPDPSPRDPPFRSNHWDTRPGGFVSQQHAGNDHRNSSRRNYGPHPHGDGTYRNSYGGRKDHDRGNYPNARDVHMQSQRAPPRGFVRPAPPNNPAFIPPQPVRPFGNPIGVPEFIYTMPMDPLRAVQFITHGSPPAMFVPVTEPSLPGLLINQIDYYFSDANLIKDEFLRSNMDDHGWVPISLIASFPRVELEVKGLTQNIQLILSSLRASTVVEVQDDKVRKRNEWMRWIPTSGRLTTEPGSSSPGNSSFNVMATSFQKMTMEDAATSQNSLAGNKDPNSEAGPGSNSTESTAQSHLSNGDVTQSTQSS